MSSIPGLTLESYVMWNHNLVVIGYLRRIYPRRHKGKEKEESIKMATFSFGTSANTSLQIAEALGVNTRRVNLSPAQFDTILSIYEPYRAIVETRLADFNEESQSWRTYAGSCFNDIEETIGDEVSRTLHNFSTERTMKFQGSNV